MTPGREIYWNISWGWLVYPLGILAFAILALGLYARIKRWRNGRSPEPLTEVSARLRRALLQVVVQPRLLREAYAGIMHFLLFWGFVVLFIGTLLVMVHEDFRVRILQGDFYLGYKLALNIFGIGALIGILMAGYRRYIARAERLERNGAFDVAIAFIFLVLVTGFLVEGFRIAATELPQQLRWAPFALGGWLVALAVQGLSEGQLRTLHAITWTAHMLLAYGFIAYCVGWSTMAHIPLGPLNIFLGRLNSTGALKPITDFKDKRSLGAGKVADLAWKDLVDVDACVRCGRCQQACPAASTGKALSPRTIVQKIRADMVRTMAGLGRPGHKPQAEPPQDVTALTGPNISEEEIWACTTCGACQHQCPLFVEPMTKILEMRRHLVMVKGKLPDTAQVATVSLQKRGHPWTGTPYTRTDWLEGLALDQLSATGKGDLLLWVGCAGALVDRNMRVSAALTRVLRGAGVDFSILGDEETCCGDPARRIGNEYLFQTIAKKNVKLLQSHKVHTILTTCPHCYNTFKNEYPYFGGQFEVVHHSEFLADLLRRGILKFDAPLLDPLTYHDPCYLGRHNGVYDSPRDLMRAVAGKNFREMARCRATSFCCGGGGGRAWMEETAGTRINQERSREALGSGAVIVATACPLCLQMFEDGIRGIGGEEQLKAFDLAELIDRALVTDGIARGHLQ